MRTTTWPHRVTTTRTRPAWWRWPSTPARRSSTTTPTCSQLPVSRRRHPIGTSRTSSTPVTQSKLPAWTYCVTFGTVGWFFEQILANSGGLYFNENNGRTGRADRGRVQQGSGCRGLRLPFGTHRRRAMRPNLGSTWSDTDSVFFAGEAAMIFDSTSGARGFQDNCGLRGQDGLHPAQRQQRPQRCRHRWRRSLADRFRRRRREPGGLGLHEVHDRG